jgi:NADH-quinone oxidoreductase subunit H
MLCNSLDLVEITNKQAGNILNWNIFGSGALIKAWFLASSSMGAHLHMVLHVLAAALLALCCILLFGIYVTGATAEVNRIPFDLPEAESELVSGYNTEYSGIKFAIFFLAEFTNLFVVCSIATIMFLGGGHGPSSSLDSAMVSWFHNLTAHNALSSFVNPVTLVAALWIIVKTYSLVIFAILVRGTLPRFRIDQLMDFGWKRLIPLSLILLLAVMYLKELV